MNKIIPNEFLNSINSIHKEWVLLKGNILIIFVG